MTVVYTYSEIPWKAFLQESAWGKGISGKRAKAGNKKSDHMFLYVDVYFQ